MNTLTLIGIILIVLGAVVLIYGGITYTSKKDIVDIGDLKIQTEKQKGSLLEAIRFLCCG